MPAATFVQSPHLAYHPVAARRREGGGRKGEGVGKAFHRADDLLGTYVVVRGVECECERVCESKVLYLPWFTRLPSAR